jgi:hypothetical protein
LSSPHGDQARATRDGRKFYIVDIEDLSGTAELTVWSDAIELTGESTWAEGQVLLVSVEVRERGDRLSLNVRKAAPFDRGEGSVVGFAPEQWQVEAARPRPARAPDAAKPAPATGHRPAPPPPRVPSQPAATTEAARPGVQPPVSGDTARLVVTVFETEDAVADEALLRAVAGMLKDHPGRDEVRLVIHDTEAGHELDLPHAAVSEELARASVVLRTNGAVRLTGRRYGAA